MKLHEVMISALQKEKTYVYFLQSFKDLEELYNKSEKNTKHDQQIKHYIYNLESFYKNNVKDILQYKKIIAYNYVLFLIKFYEYKSLKNFSIEYLEEFRKFAIRVMEVSLFIQQYKLNINELFFNNTQKSFYENLIYIHEINFKSQDIQIITNRDTKLINDNIKIHTDGIFIGNEKKRFHYISEVKRAVGYKNISFASYLRLYEIGVNNVYNTKNTIIKEGGGGGGQYINLEKLQPYPKKFYYHNKIVYNRFETNNNKLDRYGSNHDTDEELESINKSRKRVLNNNGKLYTIKDSAQKYNNLIEDSTLSLKQENLNNNNSYKKFKLVTAIGHLSTKANLTLESKYTVPNIKLLGKFLSEIKDKNTFEYKLLISSIVLGIEPKRIIAMKLKLTNELEIVSKNILRVDLTTAYAQVIDYEIYKNTNNKVEFIVPAFIENFFQESESILFTLLQKNIRDNITLIEKDVIKEYETCKDTSSLYNFLENNFKKEVISNIYNMFLDNQQKSIALYLNKTKKLFSKTIVLSAKNLHILTLYYYKIFHDESNINLLFLQNKTANIDTKLAYVASTQKLSTMTLWIEELMNKLSINNSNFNRAIPMDTKYSGSNKLVIPKSFKTFLTTLMNLEFNNKYANVTLKMIHIRYVFSILLTSRKYYFSANLHQYSRREQLLFIHEKEKNIFNSKRIVPIAKLGDKYIQYFLKLREEFSIMSYSPVLVQDDGKVQDFNQKNLLNWLEKHEQDFEEKCLSEEYNAVIKFVKGVVLDFGRHIFASMAHNQMELSQDYVDAMLNHFEMGTQDQSMYSLFDNQEYFREIRNIMNKIEKEYIPYWNEL